MQGLRLRVNDSGEMIFSVVYRLRGDSDGTPKTYTIGRYPDEYKIKGARDEALRVLPELKAGRDPKVAARIERAAQKKIAASQIALADAAPLYVEYFRHHKPGKDGQLGRRSWDSEESKLRVVCQIDGWGDKLIDEITDNEAAVLLDMIRDSDRNPNRIHATMIGLFNWARQPGRPFERPAINPFIELDRRGEEKERDRTLSPDEIAFFWSILTSTAVTRLDIAVSLRGAS